MAFTALRVQATGGCQFMAHLVGDRDNDVDEFIGTIEAGDLDDEGQWEGDEDDIVIRFQEMARDRIGDAAESLPVERKF